ncbi:Vacuolar protein sorting-associated protein 74 [Venturia nashicola]|uniref:Vacuolar protein sorting-associated protein 74 n=1 Tax=Venturia nashicola TaxID=86259 RepID=A0A4Z1PGJ2_9PEZI|nr:Vacuolar protein sorting-associated protein 74 [Venturia nashicola]
MHKVTLDIHTPFKTTMSQVSLEYLCYILLSPLPFPFNHQPTAATMCHFTLQAHNSCLQNNNRHNPHPTKSWQIIYCPAHHSTGIQCADIQYFPSINSQICGFCVDDLDAPSQLFSRLSDTEIWLQESLHMSIMIPVMKAKMDEERERRLLKEEIRKMFVSCRGGLDDDR